MTVGIDTSSIDIASVGLGAFSWWLWSRMMSKVYFFMWAVVSSIKGDTRELVIEKLNKRFNAWLDNRLPQWTVEK